MARDLGDLDVAVRMIDGIGFADHCCVGALAVTADGTKVPVGLWLGDTENVTVVRALLADLVARGLAATRGPLMGIDGGRPPVKGPRVPQSLILRRSSYGSVTQRHAGTMVVATSWRV